MNLTPLDGDGDDVVRAMRLSAAALRPSGLSPCGSQAKPAAAIAGVCLDLLARQHERNVRIMSGDSQ